MTAAVEDVGAFERALRARVDGEVRFDPGSRAAYSTDASNYRQVPIAVVLPRTISAAVAAVAVCYEHGAPLLSRGGGTSLAGQATNAAVVLDWSKYCHRLVSVDPAARTCVVEPGLVLDRLNGLLGAHGLRFGPEPATHSRCTLGGMIGNNSCGATAQETGKVSDNVVRLEVLLYDGTRMWVGATSEQEYDRVLAAGGRPAQVYRQLRGLRDRYLEQIRTGFPDLPRRVSGYNLDALAPEQHFDLARALVGTEGTCVTVLQAELRLLPVLPHRRLLVLGYPSIDRAGDAAAGVAALGPVALEGLDSALVAQERTAGRHAGALSLLPPGEGWLLAQFAAATAAEVEAQFDAADRAVRAAGQSALARLVDEDSQQQLWAVREAALAVAARVPGQPAAWPGWEDSAVPPERLGDYLRELRDLIEEFGYGRVPVYGHFGHGCIHLRIPFDLTTAGGIGQYRAFLARAASLVVSFGGSLSGEHGDGQARGELLVRMFGPELVEAFGAFKAVFDPSGRMNPGKVVDPRPLDANLRLGADYQPWQPSRTWFGYPSDQGSFEQAVGRCIGVGLCRREGGGVMCPSYQVTREEEHSTRGRSRLLFEMMQPHPDAPLRDRWRSAEVKDALDLCLACKGCKSDCPVNVDMATYKAEFLAHYYHGRLRPRADYAMGWLPLVARVATRSPQLVNALTQAPGLAAVLRWAGGIDPHRAIPLFAPHSLQAWAATERVAGGSGQRGEVLLWPDTFTNYFQPEIGRAAIRVLETAGWRVRVPAAALCCGLTWISTGQLEVARRVLRRSIGLLAPHVRRGGLVLGLEPSCTAALRSDAHELFPHDPDVTRLAAQTVTLAELLHEHSPGWRPPVLAGQAIAQTHCHQHAVLGFGADLAVLKQAGVQATTLDSGCCGLAGNFGFTAGHHEVSLGCAERVLLPAVRSAAATTMVLADGFSCRTQIDQSDAGGRQALHLAEVLCAGLDRDLRTTPEYPEREWAPRTRPPSRPREWAVTAAVGTGVIAAAVGSRR